MGLKKEHHEQKKFIDRNTRPVQRLPARTNPTRISQRYLYFKFAHDRSAYLSSVRSVPELIRGNRNNVVSPDVSASGDWGIRVPKELPTNRGSTGSTDTIASASRTHTILLFCIMTKNVSTCPTK